MKNFICSGERIVVTAPSGGLNAGDAYLVGSKICVVLSGGLEGEKVTLATEGVFEITKVAGAINIGQKLYIDSTGKLTTTANGNNYAGYAFVASLTGDATGFVTLVDNPGDTPDVTQAAKVDAIGATTPLTAIGATFADLAAARTGVNTLRTDTEARLAAIEVKVDAILASLKAADLMLSV